MNKKKRKALIITVIVILLIVSAPVYFSIYYHADERALQALESTESITVICEKDYAAFVPEEPVCGLIFYPGAKIEHISYAPLMQSIAQKDILCVVVDVPLKFAFTKTNAADGIYGDFPQVTQWYVGGHSLGGAIASIYASKNSDKLEGVMLFASYSTKDLSAKELNVISVYGSSDGVLSRERYEKYSANLPAGFSEYVIEGGNHSNFGSYGFQRGDGEAALTMDEQQELTSGFIAEKISR